MRRPSVDNSFAVGHPDLVTQWHPTKNAPLTPFDVTPHSNKKLWWMCPSGHEFHRCPHNHVKSKGRCPVCTGRALGSDNHLAAKMPEVARQWHPDRNGDIRPDQVMVKSNKYAWWRCDRGHEYRMLISHRTEGCGCPFCSGRRASVEDNLAVRSPHIAVEWHPSKNGSIKPNDVRHGATLTAWWLCPAGHEYQMSVYGRSNGLRCPYCYGTRTSETRGLEAEHPEVAATWHPTRNGRLLASDVFSSSAVKVWWMCQAGHEFEAPPSVRTRQKGCPYCLGRRIAKDNSLAALHHSIASEWHPVKNDGLTPDKVLPNGQRIAWWICPEGHDYKCTVRNRVVLGTGCGICCGRQVDETNSLETMLPHLVEQWDQARNGDVLPSQVYYQSKSKYWWTCLRGHSWETTVRYRALGSDCPHCSLKTSRMEIFVYCELKHVFDNVEWRTKINGREADIFLPAHGVVVEVDGSFWHRDIAERDRKKTEAFEKLGFIVFRVREKDLSLMSNRDVSCQPGQCDAKVVIALLRKIDEHVRLPERFRASLARYCVEGCHQNRSFFEEILSAVRGNHRPELIASKHYSLSGHVQSS